MRILLIAAILLQGFVLALGSGAIGADASVAGCGCACAAKAGSCCPPPVGEDEEACRASLGTALCACSSQPGAQHSSSEGTVPREAGPDRGPSACVATIVDLVPASIARPGSRPVTSPPHAPSSTCALLCTWLS